MTTLLQLLGPQGAGKTTLMPALAQAFLRLQATQVSPGEVPENLILLLDAAVDQGLSRLALGSGFGGDTIPKTLTQIAQGLMEKPMDDDASRREFIDWAFQDLPARLPTDWLSNGGDTEALFAEVIALGPLRERLPERLWQGLIYGLQRVVHHHNLVLIDEDHPLIRASFQTEGLLRTILVTTPRHDPDTWPPLPDEGAVHLVINRFDGSPLHPAIAQRVEHGEVKLVGKLPVYASQGIMHQQLAGDLCDLLLKVNLPLRTP